MPAPGEIAVGIVAASVLIVTARMWAKREHVVYAAGLIVAAGIYVGFAFVHGDGAWIALEGAGLVLFSVVAAAGLWLSHSILAVGWAVHVVWDVALHSQSRVGAIADWYPSVCVGFDLAIAGYIGWSLAHSRRARPA